MTLQFETTETGLGMFMDTVNYGFRFSH